MEEFGCQVMAWGPLEEGKNNIFTNKILSEIGAVHNKTAAQAALRYLLQLKVIIIPKTSEEMERILELDTESAFLGITIVPKPQSLF